MVFDLLLVALAITLDPLPLMAFVLVVASAGGGRTGFVFILGWLACFVLVITLVLTLTGGHSPAPRSPPSTARLVVKLLVGGSLVLYGLRRHGRHGRHVPHVRHGRPARRRAAADGAAGPRRGPPRTGRPQGVPLSAHITASGVVVVMGVSGSGKSTVGALLARRLAVPFLEGDALHSAAARAKMASGHPLDDADRGPWLAALTRWIRDADERGSGGVVACSALKRSYRDQLRGAGDGVYFVHLALDRRPAARRMARRTDHFMPPGLLDSQYAILEPLRPDEPGVTVDASGTPQQSVAQALRALSRRPGTRPGGPPADGPGPSPRADPRPPA